MDLCGRGMRNHTKVYFEYFGYGMYDFIPCELTGQRAVDINHIDCKGMGGSKTKDNIENLIAMTRQLHIDFGDISELKEPLRLIHKHFMETRQPIFDYTPTREEILNWKS